MSLSHAFTLLELLVVMTIVAILLAAGIPMYDHYIINAHVTNMLNTGHAYQLKLVDKIMTGDIERIDLAGQGDQIARVSVFALDEDPIKYIIEVEAKMHTQHQKGIGLKQPKNADKPLILQLQGSAAGEQIVWTCHVSSEYNDYVPNNCRNNDFIE